LGVFAVTDIKPRATIEVCPVILVPANEGKLLGRTALTNYYFEFTSRYVAICLGHGSLYNHSYHANAIYDIDAKRRLIIFKAVKPIKKNQEIFINYNYDPEDQTPLETWWDKGFKDRSKRRGSR
jgi:SET domain-containing protein